MKSPNQDTPIQDNQALEAKPVRNFSKRIYVAPVLRVYGDLRDITRSSGSKGGDAKGMMTCDPRVKQDIALVGHHPMGVGLYLYRYKPELRGQYGSGVYFGVMADELAGVAPDAVSLAENGYLQVDYRQLKPELELGMLHS
jgi:hypothetical protein